MPMGEEIFDRELNKISSAVTAASNFRYTDDNYLGSVLYQLQSRMYMEGVRRDVNYLLELLPPRARVLDFGGGIGFMGVFLNRFGARCSVIETVDNKSLEGERGRQLAGSMSLDLLEVWGRLAAENADVDFNLYDGRRLPFADQTFDAVIAYAVIEHIEGSQVAAALNEINRVLKDKGTFFIARLPRRYALTEWTARWLRLGSHSNLWRRGQIRELLNRSGFTVLSVENTDAIMSFPIRLTNPLFPIIKRVDPVLLKTPLSLLAHHLRIVSTKEAG